MFREISRMLQQLWSKNNVPSVAIQRWSITPCSCVLLMKVKPSSSHVPNALTKQSSTVSRHSQHSAASYLNSIQEEEGAVTVVVFFSQCRVQQVQGYAELCRDRNPRGLTLHNTIDHGSELESSFSLSLLSCSGVMCQSPLMEAFVAGIAGQLSSREISHLSNWLTRLRVNPGHLESVWFSTFFVFRKKNWISVTAAARERRAGSNPLSTIHDLPFALKIDAKRLISKQQQQQQLLRCQKGERVREKERQGHDAIEPVPTLRVLSRSKSPFLPPTPIGANGSKSRRQPYICPKKGIARGGYPSHQQKCQ